ncbi:MAG: hypothetical protein WDM96_13130 [Lacunisphaera sp.]
MKPTSPAHLRSAFPSLSFSVHAYDHPPQPERNLSRHGAQADFRSPHYECMDLPQALKLAVYVPGVEASGVDVTTQDTDLLITAHKTHLPARELAGAAP